MVVMVMSRGSEQASGHVGWPRGVGRRWWSRRATVSRGGRLVVHGRQWLMMRRGHREGQGSKRGGGGRGRVRWGHRRAETVRMMRVVVRVRVRMRDTRLSGGLSHSAIATASCDDVSVLELGSARLLSRQLQLHKHHVVTYT